ncbi:sugar kinase [Flavihumibacter solisilvae]|uniref:Carbohydrate kinase n=1 Tax=Flavihumibacter solisilvae TaxID=1349421 RepID=A0A0C1LL17_9BACT|nr:sugar kinase [Flavihumibacter solisilvae]KIC96023.1 carbohydrate kinase [Flavihumibacter solisilvae]
MRTVLCFGEPLLRFAYGNNWIEDAAMPVYVGGAELNTATALARWGVPVRYATAIPDNQISAEIITELKRRNIQTDAIMFSGERMGAYYLPRGAELKHAGVIYDRAGSAFANLQTGQIDWDKEMAEVSWFHFSAISPALNANSAAVCAEALDAASRKNITISVDLNYRAKLWQYGKAPVEVIPALVQHCDVIMGNIWAAEKMLGIEVDPDAARDKSTLVQESGRSAEKLMLQFQRCRQVANTFRFENESGLQYYATMYSSGKLFVSSEYSTTGIVDKVGSGDCFMAGLIYGNFNKYREQCTLDFATAAAFDKLFIAGDCTSSTIESILQKMKHA